MEMEDQQPSADADGYYDAGGEKAIPAGVVLGHRAEIGVLSR